MVLADERVHACVRAPPTPETSSKEPIRMAHHSALRLTAAAALLVGTLAACADGRRDGAPGNPPSTATQRTYDQVTGSGPTAPDATRGNPPGTTAERAYDRATGSNVSGAYPQSSGGVRQR
jgi:hypothetical protein